MLYLPLFPLLSLPLTLASASPLVTRQSTQPESIKLQSKTDGKCLSRTPKVKFDDPNIIDSSTTPILEPCIWAPRIEMYTDGTVGKIKVNPPQPNAQEEGALVPQVERWDDTTLTVWLKVPEEGNSAQDFSYDGSRIHFEGQPLNAVVPDDVKLCLGLHRKDGDNYVMQLDNCGEGPDTPGSDVQQVWEIQH